MKILIASNNKHKIKEITTILNFERFPDIEFITPDDLISDNFEVEENGITFLENAKIKATEFFKRFNIPTISDDSGLEVNILNGSPGVYSARYSGINASDASNRLKLINEIIRLGLQETEAQFHCSICFFDGNNYLFADGVCKGKVIIEERGENGFGYDPIFIPKNFQETFAELNEIDKNQISHRANALSNFLSIFADYYKTLSLI